MLEKEGLIKRENLLKRELLERDRGAYCGEGAYLERWLIREMGVQGRARGLIRENGDY